MAEVFLSVVIVAEIDKLKRTKAKNKKVLEALSE
jgi:hypothetical protein